MEDYPVAAVENISKNITNEATRKSSQNTLEFFNKRIKNLIGGWEDNFCIKLFLINIIWKIVILWFNENQTFF